MIIRKNFPGPSTEDSDRFRADPSCRKASCVELEVERGTTPTVSGGRSFFLSRSQKRLKKKENLITAYYEMNNLVVSEANQEKKSSL